MKSIISLLLILQVIINGVVNLVIAEIPPQKEPWETNNNHVCRGGDFKSSTIQKNKDSALDKLLELVKSKTYNGFHHTQAGDKSEEQVIATFLCPPHIQGLCECCLKNAVTRLRKLCPKQSEGVAWGNYAYLNCILRYSTGRKILSVLDDWAWYNDVYAEEHVNAIALEKTMNSLTSKLKEKAAGGGDLKKYAEGSENYDGDELALYLGFQCSADLSKGDCIKCLSNVSNRLSSCCVGKKLFSGRVQSTNCYGWYSHISFLNPPDVYHKRYCG